MPLTYRPFASFAGRLRAEEVDTATKILQEHAAADATTKQAKAVKETELADANRLRIAESAELHGPRVTQFIADVVYNALRNALKEEDFLIGFDLTEVKAVGPYECTVGVRAKSSGEHRIFIVNVK